MSFSLSNLDNITLDQRQPLQSLLTRTIDQKMRIDKLHKALILSDVSVFSCLLPHINGAETESSMMTQFEKFCKYWFVFQFQPTIGKAINFSVESMKLHMSIVHNGLVSLIHWFWQTYISSKLTECKQMQVRYIAQKMRLVELHLAITLSEFYNDLQGINQVEIWFEGMEMECWFWVQLYEYQSVSLMWHIIR